MQWRRLVPALLPQLYGKELEKFKEVTPYSEYEAYSEVDEKNIDRWMLADQRFHLQSILAKVDGMSMANSVEIRVPLLDRRIVEFAGKCDSRLMMPRNQPGKYLLRQVVKSLGAPGSVHSAKKMGFNTPIAKSLREDLAPLGNRLLFENADILAPYFNPDSVQRIWKRAHCSRM